MEVGKRVRVIGADDTGVIEKIYTQGKYRIMVRLDDDSDEGTWPFDAEELEVIG